MSSNESRSESKCIPFCIHSCKHFISIDLEFVADDGNLVHECDVDISLTVLNNLYRLSRLDVGYEERARLDDDVINLLYLLCRFLIHSGNDLANIRQCMYPVSRIDTLG